MPPVLEQLFPPNAGIGCCEPGIRNLLSRRSRRSWIAHKRRFLADYQRAAKQLTLPADKRTGLLQ
jgi:hypothetical protein